MGANGAKKGWLDRMFRGEAVTDEAYGAKETETKDKDMFNEAIYSTRTETQSPARKDNVVEFPKAQTRPTVTAPGSVTGSYRRDSMPTREIGSSGGGSGGGFDHLSDSGDAYVVFKRLKDFTAATQVADRMTEQKIVILNLESCDDETARRVLDFIGGVAYACSSMVKRIAGRVFMITPKGVSSDGEFFDEVKNGNVGIKYDD